MIHRCCQFAVLLVLCSWLSGLALHAAEEHDVRVMSFNIRYGTARDGENAWDARKEFVVETIRAFAPDLLGTQETLGFQRDFLAEHLPDYDLLGVGRDDGKDRGEMMALYYRKARFEKLAGGHFWLSETPDVAGSKSWDSSLPRMVTWVTLRDRQQPARSLTFLNTHFDHQGPQARLNSAKLIRQRILEFGPATDIVLTGDFNAGENSEPYQALFGAIEGKPAPVVDSFRQVHATRGAAEGTFSGFRAASTEGPRIDWIGVSPGWRIKGAAIDRTERDGRTPSDHFPVTAILAR